MKSFLIGLRAGIVIVALGASAANAALMTYTSRAGFDAATTQREIEPFVAEPGEFYYINQEYRGIIYPEFSYFVDPGYAPELYEWGSGPVLLLDNESTLRFVEPVTAFAAEFGTLPDGFTLTVTIDGLATVLSTPTVRQLTFFGWTSSTPFSSVTFSSQAEYLILDNVIRAAAIAPPPFEVPEPSPLALAAVGLLAFGARRRKTR